MGQPVDMLTKLAELLHEPEYVVVAHVAAGTDPLLFESLRGDLADTPDSIDRQVLEESVDLVRGDDILPVGLVPVARDLGDELVRRDPGGHGDADIARDTPADFLRNQRRAAVPARAGGHVEKGFVERQRLDQFGVVGEYVVHLPRCLAVDGHASRDQDQLRAAFERGRARHRRAHAELARLVARGRDHAATRRAAADGNRFALQCRVVAHLDGGVKTVCIDMNDLALGRRF